MQFYSRFDILFLPRRLGGFEILAWETIFQTLVFSEFLLFNNRDYKDDNDAIITENGSIMET
jgi:hypothetical protein